jgi:hypothetical protein
MEFIDKTKQKVRGETIISDFLNEFRGVYHKNLYSEFNLEEIKTSNQLFYTKL